MSLLPTTTYGGPSEPFFVLASGQAEPPGPGEPQVIEGALTIRGKTTAEGGLVVGSTAAGDNFIVGADVDGGLAPVRVVSDLLVGPVGVPASGPANIVMKADTGNMSTNGTITSAGAITAVAGGITATAGNITATAGNIVATAGNLQAVNPAVVSQVYNLNVLGALTFENPVDPGTPGIQLPRLSGIPFNPLPGTTVVPAGVDVMVGTFSIANGSTPVTTIFTLDAPTWNTQTDSVIVVMGAYSANLSGGVTGTYAPAVSTRGLNLWDITIGTPGVYPAGTTIGVTIIHLAGKAFVP